MTTPDLTYATLLQRLDAIDARVRDLVEHQRRADELFSEMTPIAREVLATATSHLDDLEKKGYFAFAREASLVAQRVIEGYTAEDVRALGDAIVGILDTVRTMTQPEVLKVIGETGQVLAHADGAHPLGLYGMVRATRQQDVQRGMAVMMELLKKLGQGADAAAAKRAATRKKPPPRRALGTERPVTPKTCAAPRPAAQSTVIDGIAYTAEGHLVDAAQWSPALAQAIADLSGVALTDKHWEVLHAARKDYATLGVAPNIRRLTQVAGVTTRDLYALFPRAPGRTIAKIAGLPKPAGCL